MIRIPSILITRIFAPLVIKLPSDTTSKTLPSMFTLPAGRSSVKTIPYLFK